MSKYRIRFHLEDKRPFVIVGERFCETKGLLLLNYYDVSSDHFVNNWKEEFKPVDLKQMSVFEIDQCSRPLGFDTMSLDVRITFGLMRLNLAGKVKGYEHKEGRLVLDLLNGKRMVLLDSTASFNTKVAFLYELLLLNAGAKDEN